MIDFKQKDRVLPSALIVIALVIMAGATVFDRVTALPSGTTVGTSHGVTRRRMAKDIKLAKLDGEKARIALSSKVWQGNPEAVGAGVLALITNASNQQSLQLGAFRPQRVQSLGAVTELPYTVQISGPYPGIQAIMSSLDAPSSKVVLRSAQIGSSQQGSSVVSATLGVSAYLAADPQLIAKNAPSPNIGGKGAETGNAAGASSAPASSSKQGRSLGRSVAEGREGDHPAAMSTVTGGTHG